jgi:hypothetical protein
MAYTVTNYATKKALIEDFKAGKQIEVYQPGGMFPLRAGSTSIEGPHYPKPHKWYASGEVESIGGRMILTKVK